MVHRQLQNKGRRKQSGLYLLGLMAFGWCFLLLESFSKVSSFPFAFYLRKFCQYPPQPYALKWYEFPISAFIAKWQVTFPVFCHCIKNYYLQEYCLLLFPNTRNTVEFLKLNAIEFK